MPSGIRRPSLTMTFSPEPSGFADNTCPALALRKNKRPESGLATDCAAFAFEFADDIAFIPFSFFRLALPFLRAFFIKAWFRLTAQTSLILRSIVLMTESIL